MPRYFFNIDNSAYEADDEGTEFDNPEVARVQAVVFAGDYLSNDPSLIWNGHHLSIDVRDEAGDVLLRVDISTSIPGHPT